jgi:hypothetical protein
MAGFKREARNSAAKSERSDRGERTERRSSGKSDRSSRSSGGGFSEKKYAFTNIGNVKQGRGMGDKDAAQLKGCEESIKLKLYMPGVVKLTLENKAIMGIKLGQRSEDEKFVLGQAFLPLGSITPTKKTEEDFQEFLKEYGEVTDFDMIADIYLPKGQEEITLYSGQTLLLTFKTGEKAEEIDYVLGTLSIANDQE